MSEPNPITTAPTASTTTTTTNAAAPTTARRSYRACLNCRKHKTKCDLGDVDAPRSSPCSKCKRTRTECVFSEGRRGARANTAEKRRRSVDESRRRSSEDRDLEDDSEDGYGTRRRKDREPRTSRSRRTPEAQSRGDLDRRRGSDRRDRDRHDDRRDRRGADSRDRDYDNGYARTDRHRMGGYSSSSRGGYERGYSSSAHVPDRATGFIQLQGDDRMDGSAGERLGDGEVRVERIPIGPGEAYRTFYQNNAGTLHNGQGLSTAAYEPFRSTAQSRSALENAALVS